MVEQGRIMDGWRLYSGVWLWLYFILQLALMTFRHISVNFCNKFLFHSWIQITSKSNRVFVVARHTLPKHSRTLTKYLLLTINKQINNFISFFTKQTIIWLIYDSGIKRCGVKACDTQEESETRRCDIDTLERQQIYNDDWVSSCVSRIKFYNHPVASPMVLYKSDYYYYYYY